MGATTVGHPLESASDTIDSEYSLEVLLEKATGFDDAGSTAVRMRACAFGFTGSDLESQSEHPLVGEGPALVHAVKQAIGHGFPVIVRGAWRQGPGHVLDEDTAEDSEGLVIAYRRDGTFLVVDAHASSWVEGAWLFAGHAVSIMNVKVAAAKAPEGKTN